VDFSGVLLLYILLFTTGVIGNSNAGIAREGHSIFRKEAEAYFAG